MPQFKSDQIIVSLGDLADYADRIRLSEVARGKKYSELPVYGTAWTTMLYLLSENLRGRAVKQTSLAGHAGVPGTTALRHIALLAEGGHVALMDDPKDKRTTPVALTQQGMTDVAGLLTHQLSQVWGLPVRHAQQPTSIVPSLQEAESQEAVAQATVEKLRAEIEDLNRKLQSVASEFQRHLDTTAK